MSKNYVEMGVYYMDKINLIIKSIPRGFIYGNYIVISDVDIFSLGNTVKKYKSKFKTGTRTSNILDINKGDFVVHEMFGIGIYDGLVTIPKNGMKKDYLKIIYADGTLNDASWIELMLYGAIMVLPKIAVSYIVGLGIEFAWAQWKGEEIFSLTATSGAPFLEVFPRTITSTLTL